MLHTLSATRPCVANIYFTFCGVNGLDPSKLYGFEFQVINAIHTTRCGVWARKLGRQGCSMIAADRTLEFFQIVNLLQSSGPAQHTQRGSTSDDAESQDEWFAPAVNQMAFNISHVRFEIDSLENHFKSGAALPAGGRDSTGAPEQKVLAVKTSLQKLQQEAKALGDREARSWRGHSAQNHEHRKVVLQRIVDDLKRMAQRFKGILEQHQKRRKKRKNRFSKFGPDFSTSFDAQNLRRNSGSNNRDAPGSQAGHVAGQMQPHNNLHNADAANSSRATAAGQPGLQSSAHMGGAAGMRRRHYGPRSAASGTAKSFAYGSPTRPQLAAGAMGLVEDTQQLIPESTYDQQRGNDVRQMESTIVEMGSMFQQVYASSQFRSLLRTFQHQRNLFTLFVTMSSLSSTIL